MSEIDLMTREELVLFFANEGISIDYSNDISVSGFVTPHNENLCDFEVGATVRYSNKKNKASTEACYVCFTGEKTEKGYKSIEPMLTYCVE